MSRRYFLIRSAVRTTVGMIALFVVILAVHGLGAFLESIIL